MKKQLPSTWVRTTLERLLKPLEDGRILHHGWSPQCAKEPADGDEQWGVLKTTAIQPGVFLPQHNKRLPAHLVPRPQHEVRTGDLLITCAGPRVRCGIPCLVRTTRPKLMLSGKMYRFRVSPDCVDPSYLEKYLLSAEAQEAIDGMKTGGNESGLNLTHDRFKPLAIPLAPVKEQRRIASKIDELFSRIGEGERALERVQQLLERYRQSVLKAAVTGELTRGWREKNKDKLESGEELLARILKKRREAWEISIAERSARAGSISGMRARTGNYEEPLSNFRDDLPPLPEGWIWGTVDQVGFVTGGLTKNARRGEHELQRPYLRVANVYANHLDLDDVQSIGVTSAELDRVTLRAGDVLVVEGNGSVEQIGRVALWDGSIADCVHQNHIIKVRGTGALPSWFILIWCMSPQGREYIRRAASSTAGLHTLSISKIQSLPIPVPTAGELAEIESRFNEMESLVGAQLSAVRMESSRLSALRQSVLKTAFSGRLVSQQPGDEPASALLARIAAERASAKAPPRPTRRKKSTR